MFWLGVFLLKKTSDMDDVRLYEPDGTLNGEVSRDYAIAFCRENAGWFWEEID